MNKIGEEIIIKNDKTEITINEQAISVSAPNVLVTVMTDGESTSVTTVTKNGIVTQVDGKEKVTPLKEVKDAFEESFHQPQKVALQIGGKTICEILKEEAKRSGKSLFFP